MEKSERGRGRGEERGRRERERVTQDEKKRERFLSNCIKVAHFNDRNYHGSHQGTGWLYDYLALCNDQLVF